MFFNPRCTISELLALVIIQLFFIFSTKSVKIVVNPNNDIPFTTVSLQLNIERSKLWLCSFQIYTILFLHAVVFFKKQNRPTQMP